MGDLNEFAKPDTVYELNIGKSFYPGNKSSFHQFKCESIFIFNFIETSFLYLLKLLITLI
jgi:hypothetical protein